MKILNVHVFVWHFVRCQEYCGDPVRVGGLVPSDTHLSRSFSHPQPHHVVLAICAMCRLRTDSTTAEAPHVLVNGSVAIVFRPASQSRFRQQDFNLSRNTQHVHTMSSCKYDHVPKRSQVLAATNLPRMLVKMLPATLITPHARQSRVAPLALWVHHRRSGCWSVSLCENRTDTSNPLLLEEPLSPARPCKHPPSGGMFLRPSTSSCLHLVCHRDTANALPVQCPVLAGAWWAGFVVLAPVQARRSLASHPCRFRQQLQLSQPGWRPLPVRAEMERAAVAEVPSISISQPLPG